MLRAVAVLVALLMVCTAAPSVAADDGALSTTATFTKAAYVSTDDDVRFTLTVENTGTESVADVHVLLATDLEVDWTTLGGLAAPGTTLAPGERVNVEVRVLSWPPMDRLRVGVETWVADQRQGEQTVEAPMTMLRGTVSGVVYGDLDGDHVVDPGEELVGGTVSVTGGMPLYDEEVRVGVGGVFTFPDLPAGHYSVSTTVSPLWQTTVDSLDVPNGPTTWVIRAERYPAATLTASATLDRDSYALGATVREHVELTNTGTTDLVGVYASCDMDNANMLSSDGWGVLSPDGGGVTLRPGQRRTFDFTDVVPKDADRYGYLDLNCWFFAGGGKLAAETRDRATVPGRSGSVTGQVCQPDTLPCAPVPDVRMLLLNDTGDIVARVVAGADGRFEIPVLGAGSYEIRFAGPWRLAPNADTHHRVVAEQTIDWRLDVVPGPSLADPEAPAVTGTPAPMARPRPAQLADTGVNVGGLLTLGALLLLSGLVLLGVFSRRPGGVLPPGSPRPDPRR